MNGRLFAGGRPLPLWLLVRVNIVQGWRRLLAIREKSKLMVAVISSFVLGYLVIAFLLFQQGLRFMTGFPGLGTVLTERLLYLLFAFLFGLLLLSSLIICYTNFFRNRETMFLLTLPIERRTVFRWKFIESVTLASWAFVFLTAPLLLAFGMVRDVAWHFYLVTGVLTVMLIVLPGVAGAWLALHLARHLDRKSFQIGLLVGLAGLLVAAFVWQTQSPSDEMLESRVLVALDQLLGRTRFAIFPFLPSYQLAAGILHWSEGMLRVASFYMLVLFSGTLFFGTLAFTRLGGLFYDSASLAQGRAGVPGQWNWLWPFQRRHRPGLAGPGLLHRLLRRLPGVRPETAALLHKDILMFWRDTTQWGQTVMLFGLLGAYILNLRHFTHQLTSPFWLHLVSYLNLGTCSLTLATLTTRFVFPQFSLEGQRLWIIGLAPMGLERVVRIKFWLASLTSLCITLGLVLLSCHLLHLSWHQTGVFSAAITLMTLALNGLAVGLGVLYPNFRDPSASKIVSGFGGTLCLVLSFVYILISVLLLAMGAGGFQLPAEWQGAALGIFGLLALLTALLPLHMARRRLRHLEV